MASIFVGGPSAGMNPGNFKVIFFPQVDGDIPTTADASHLSLDTSIIDINDINDIKLTLQRHTEAISLLTTTLMEMQKKLSDEGID